MTTLTKYASTEVEYFVTLLNSAASNDVNPISVKISSLEEDLSFALCKVWSHYFSTFNERFWSNNFPIVSIQIAPNHGIPVTFMRAVANGDPRYYLLRSAADPSKVYEMVLKRDYRYTEYKVSDGELPFEDTTKAREIVKLAVTLEKMLGCDLRIDFRIVDDGDFHIVALDDITQTQLTTYELEHEFDTMSMADDLNPKYDHHTPLTLSAVISPMSQAQQLAFYDNQTNGLYVIGKRIRKLKINLPTAATIQRLLAIDGELALHNIIANARQLKYADEVRAVKFVEKVRKLCNASSQGDDDASLKSLILQMTEVLKMSSEFWNYYYNLMVIQRSWLYLIFKYFCGTSEGKCNGVFFFKA